MRNNIDISSEGESGEKVSVEGGGEERGGVEGWVGGCQESDLPCR